MHEHEEAEADLVDIARIEQAHRNLHLVGAQAQNDLVKANADALVAQAEHYRARAAFWRSLAGVAAMAGFAGGVAGLGALAQWIVHSV